MVLSQNIAKITVEIPAEKRFLFGDKIVYRVKIESLLKFDKIRVNFEKKNNPDYMFYKFDVVEYKDNYKTDGKIIFQFFKTGKIKLPNFTILLLKRTKEGDVEIFKKNFEGLSFNFISVLKGGENISPPIPPESSYFLLLVIFISLIIGLIIIGLIFRKKGKKEERVNPLVDLRKRVKSFKKRKELSYNKEVFFDAGKLLRESLSLLNNENFKSLTVKEIEKFIKSGTLHYEINRKGVKILKELELRKFADYNTGKQVLEETFSLIENILKRVKDV